MLSELLGMSEGILRDLHEDHEAVSDLIERILRADTAEHRTSLFKELMPKLLVHAHAEQNVLYKKIEKSADGETRRFGFSGTNEHQIVEKQLQQLSRARNKASEQWTAQMSVLSELVKHHVNEEEATGFTCARREFDREELVKLGEQFRRQKEKLMAQA